MTSGVWWWRAALGVVVFAVLEVVFVLLRADPDPLRLALVVALIGGACSLVLDVTRVEPAVWPVRRQPDPGLARQDPRTAAYLRLLESHLTSREPSAVLRERLRDLAEQVMRARHDLALDDPRGRELVGPELARVLSGPPRRLDVVDIERCVRRIEEL